MVLQKGLCKGRLRRHRTITAFRRRYSLPACFCHTYPKISVISLRYCGLSDACYLLTARESLDVINKCRHIGLVDIAEHLAV